MKDQKDYSTYFHINNGGVSIEFDLHEKYECPVIKIEASHFGMTTNTLILNTDIYSLTRLRDNLNEFLDNNINAINNNNTVALAKVFKKGSEVIAEGNGVEEIEDIINQTSNIDFSYLNDKEKESFNKMLKSKSKKIKKIL